MYRLKLWIHWPMIYIYICNTVIINFLDYWLGLYWLQQLGKWWCRSQVAWLFTFEAPWGDKRTYEKKDCIRFRMFCLNHGLCACFVCLFRSVLFCFVSFCFVLFVCLFAFSVSFSALAFQFPLCFAFLACFLFFHCLFGSPLFRFRRLYIYVFFILLCVLFWCPLFLYVLHVACWFYLLPFLWRARTLSITGFVFIHYHIQFNHKRDKRP